MKKMKRNEKILVIATGILLLSILLVLSTLPGVLTDTSPNANPRSAATGFSLAVLIRLVIFAAYLKIMRDNRNSDINRRGEYLGLGILLIIFGLVLMDGAVALLSHENMLYVSVLLFTSTCCDFAAALMTIVLYFLKPQKT